jgi:hypothetical protein
MSRIPKNVLELPMEQRALMAFRSAVRKAIAEHRRLGIPAYVLSRGKIVDISTPKSSRRTHGTSRTSAGPRKPR